MQRVIVCAAARCTKTGIVVCGVRHGDNSMLPFSDKFYSKHEFDEQGFLDNKGSFLSRTEAWKVAEAAGQIKYRVYADTIDGGTLFSENLYQRIGSNYSNKRKRPLDIVHGNIAKDIENYSDWLGRFPT